MAAWEFSNGRVVGRTHVAAWGFSNGRVVRRTHVAAWGFRNGHEVGQTHVAAWGLGMVMKCDECTWQLVSLVMVMMQDERI